MGTANVNPILDLRQYVVEFEDGTEAELTANAIAMSMYAQCDPMETSTYYLTPLLISDEALLPFATLIKRVRGMDAHICADPRLDGNYAASGVMARPPGKSCLTSRNHIQSRQASMQLLRDYRESPLLTGGYHTC